MNLREDMTYKEIKSNIRQIRKEYLLICNSFNYKHLHDRVAFRTAVKRTIYNCSFNETQKNEIWRLLNRGYRNPLKVVIPNAK